MNDDIKAKILDDYLAGMSCNDLHHRYGISAKTIHNWVKAAGISRTLSEAKWAENALTGGHWMPNYRGVQVWQPCHANNLNNCPTHSNIIPKENTNAA